VPTHGRFLHIQDLREWQSRQKSVIGWSRTILISAALITATLLTVQRLRSMRREWHRRTPPP
jgi:hypothetical protein